MLGNIRFLSCFLGSVANLCRVDEALIVVVEVMTKFGASAVIIFMPIDSNVKKGEFLYLFFLMSYLSSFLSIGGQCFIDFNVLFVLILINSMSMSY